MRPIGFSTGALAKADFRRGIALSNVPGIGAIELSALRDHELPSLIEALPSLDLSRFSYVSFHAPSALTTLSEHDVIGMLRMVPRAWPIVVHPEIIATPALWSAFGAQLCIENMDNRKTTGRTVAELRHWFEILPAASLCLDAGHARQIDPTMTVALMMLTEFAPRLAQIHLSEVGPKGEHLPVSPVSGIAFRKLSHRIPADCPLIIESVIRADEMGAELAVARDLFSGRAERAIA